MTIPASPSGGAHGAPGGHRPPQRNSSRMIGGCAGARAASAAAMAGPQVRLGGGWNCDPSQTTTGEATAEGDGSGDDGAESGAAHPATTSATMMAEITDLLMAPRTVGHPYRFPHPRAIRSPGQMRDRASQPWERCARTAASPHQDRITAAEDEARGEVRVVERPDGISKTRLA